MAKKDDKKKKGKGAVEDEPIDLAARIGGRLPEPAAPPPPPLPPQGSEEPPSGRLDGPLPPRRNADRPAVIGMDEPPPPPIPIAPDDSEEPKGPPAIPSPRTPPGPREVDLVVTPLPTVDDWHKFEIALRRMRGVALLRPEYYRHGVAKMRVTWEGPDRLAHALRAGVPGFRIRVIGEDRWTLQILVSSENEERRPG
ncbi:MAG TPA: hypothetical protein VJQ09_09190 [Candidatus Limnocylindria bacterium]|nr:hypothetical protein [Candidatus Limnocylindria bacterium]